MTKKEMFEKIATVNAADAEIVAFCEHEIELLAKRKTSEKRGLTKVQKENVGIKDTIVEVLATGEGEMTITEICADERLAGFTPQKMAALLNQLVKEEKVEKTYDAKKKVHFALR